MLFRGSRFPPAIVTTVSQFRPPSNSLFPQPHHPLTLHTTHYTLQTTYTTIRTCNALVTQHPVAFACRLYFFRYLSSLMTDSHTISPQHQFFTKNSSSEKRADLLGWTDGRRQMAEQTGAFREYENVPKIKYIYIYIYIYTGCNRRNGPDFGRVFLMLNYTEKPQNTYIQS